MKGKNTNPRRAKTPAGVWVIIGLTVFLGLGGFGIAAFIAFRALRARRAAASAEVQPARPPVITTPVPEATAVPSPATQPPPPVARPTGAKNEGAESTPAGTGGAGEARRANQLIRHTLGRFSLIIRKSHPEKQT